MVDGDRNMSKARALARQANADLLEEDHERVKAGLTEAMALECPVAFKQYMAVQKKEVDYFDAEWAALEPVYASCRDADFWFSLGHFFLLNQKNHIAAICMQLAANSAPCHPDAGDAGKAIARVYGLNIGTRARYEAAARRLLQRLPFDRVDFLDVVRELVPDEREPEKETGAQPPLQRSLVTVLIVLLYTVWEIWWHFLR